MADPRDDAPHRTITIEQAWKACLEHRLPLELLGDACGLDTSIQAPDLHRPGLALVGHFYHHHPERIQIFGETEITFLATREATDRAQVLNALCQNGVPAIVVTRDLDAPAELLDAARANQTPIFGTSLDTGTFIRQTTRLLEELLAPTAVLHGGLVDVFGVGVMITGPSGIGKSECALELVLRGHRLVADDMVELKLRPREGLIGRSMELIKHHMEIRGLGIINVQDLFGVAAVRDQKRLELIVALEHWNPDAYYDRLGSDDEQYRMILGVKVEEARVPVRPGRTLSEIIEVAARNRILKARGVDSAKRFQDRLLEEIRRATPDTPPPGGAPLRESNE